MRITVGLVSHIHQPTKVHTHTHMHTSPCAAFSGRKLWPLEIHSALSGRGDVSINCYASVFPLGETHSSALFLPTYTSDANLPAGASARRWPSQCATVCHTRRRPWSECLCNTELHFCAHQNEIIWLCCQRCNAGVIEYIVEGSIYKALFPTFLVSLEV